MKVGTLILTVALIGIIVISLFYAFYSSKSQNQPTNHNKNSDEHDNNPTPTPPHSHPQTIGGDPATWSPIR